jgi:DNA-binding response OmpR family regulator
MSARIVVLDHDHTLHPHYRTLLEPEGYHVKCYTSLPDPRMVLMQRPALILLDYFVGSTSYGWIWLITLRTYDEDDIPVLICTVDDGTVQSHTQDLIDLEAQLLYKPFTSHALVQTVQQLTGPPVRAGVVPERRTSGVSLTSAAH